MHRFATSASRRPRRALCLGLSSLLFVAAAALATPPLPWRPTAPEVFRAPLPPDPVEEAKRLERLGADFRIERTAHFSLAVHRESRTATYRGKILEDLHAAFTRYFTDLGFELEPGPRAHAMIFTPTREQFVELVGLPDMPPNVGGIYFSTTGTGYFYDTLGRREERERRARSGELQGDLRAIRRETARLPEGATVELRYRQAPVRRYDRDEALALIDEALRRVRRQDVERVYELGEDSLGTMTHEAAHQLTREMGLVPAGSAAPRWLTEGIAMLFEPLRHGFLLETSRPHWGRWANLDAQRRAGVLVDVAALIARDGGLQDADPTKSARAYDDAWALVHFLSTTEPEAFARYVKRVRARREPPGEAQRIADFEASFGTSVGAIESRLRRFLEELGHGSDGGFDAYRATTNAD